MNRTFRVTQTVIAIILSQTLLFSIPTFAAKYVLTGTSGAGKSSIIQELTKRGYAVLPEAFTQLFFTNTNNQSSAEKFFANPVEGSRTLLNWQLTSEKSLNSSVPTFLDRGTIDVIGFANHLATALPATLIADAKDNLYDKVFFIDPLPAEYYEATDIRPATAHDALTQKLFLEKAYQDAGYLEIIHIPSSHENTHKLLTPSDRTDLLLEYIPPQPAQ